MINNSVLSVRVSGKDRDSIERLAAAHGVSVSEAARIALTYGIPLADQATNLNVARLTSLLEFIAGGIGIMIRENHSDYEDDLKRMVNERVARYHA